MIDCLHARGTGLQHWLCLMLVACFALRSMVAPGYMPSPATAPGKSLKLVICTAQGVKTISVNDTSAPPDGHDGAGADGGCAFAGLGQLADIVFPDFQLGRDTPSLPVTVACVAPRDPLRRIGAQLGSRGPPARV